MIWGTDYELMIDATWGAPYDPPTMIRGEFLENFKSKPRNSK